VTSPEQGAPASGVARFTIEAQSEYFAAGDKREKERYELQRALELELAERTGGVPTPGKKGVVTEVIVPLASSGALSAMVEVFKAWLGKRPDHRTIDVDFEVDDGVHPPRSGKLKVDATNVDDSVLSTIAGAALDPKG